MNMKSSKMRVKPLASALTVASSIEPAPGQSRGPDAATTPMRRKAKASATAVATPVASQTTVPAKTSGPVAAPVAPAIADGKTKVTFVLHEPRAQAVSLCGAFNAWSVEATPLTKQDDGKWKTTVALAPGRHEYKFVVDGQWISDPAARENVRNEHGSLNSVAEVRP